MDSLIAFFMLHGPLIWIVISSIVTVAATIAAATKTPTDDSIVAGIRKVVDALALNFGGAKNDPQLKGGGGKTP